MHHAVLTGIDRSTDRFIGYEFIDALGGFYPPTGELRPQCRLPQAPRRLHPKTAEVKPFTVAMFADMGRGTDDDAVTWHEHKPRVQYLQVSLAGRRRGLDRRRLFVRRRVLCRYQSVWDDFFEMITPWAAKILFLVCPATTSMTTQGPRGPDAVTGIHPSQIAMGVPIPAASAGFRRGDYPGSRASK